MNKKLIKISFFINIIIVLMVIFACIVMFTGIKFMYGKDLALNLSSIEMFKFFTVDSNILMGIAALIFSFEQIKLLKNKTKAIDSKFYKLYFMGVSAVSLTFFITFAYLGSIAEYGLKSLLMNSNLFFHLIIPVVSIINFIIFERTNKLTFKSTIYGIIPTLIYGIYYLTNVLMHVENGKVSPKYDFYFFVQGGIKTAIFVIPIVYLISYVIGLILWRLNRKKGK